MDNCFVFSVLLSGLCSLILTKKEETCLSPHFKVHIERLLKLFPSSPRSLVFLLAGRIPFPGLLHMRMLSLFGQICRLNSGNNVLAKHAINIFSSTSPSSWSWFWKIRDICLLYGLPHPSQLLHFPPTKLIMKKNVKNKVLSYWLETLRSEADDLPSLKYLKTRFLGLTHCHPIYSSCGSSPQ